MLNLLIVCAMPHENERISLVINGQFGNIAVHFFSSNECTKPTLKNSVLFYVLGESY